LLEKNGNNLSKMKDQLITKQLIRDPYCSYEEVFNNIYYRNALYIDRSYFEGNIARKGNVLPAVQVPGKGIQGAIECKGKANVFFIDRCSLIEGRESNVIVTVSLAGALHSEKSPDSMHFLK
jgi:filamentous hemagglutinin family protein